MQPAPHSLPKGSHLSFSSRQKVLTVAPTCPHHKIDKCRSSQSQIHYPWWVFIDHWPAESQFNNPTWISPPQPYPSSDCLVWFPETLTWRLACKKSFGVYPWINSYGDWWTQGWAEEKVEVPCSCNRASAHPVEWLLRDASPSHFVWLLSREGTTLGEPIPWPRAIPEWGTQSWPIGSKISGSRKTRLLDLGKFGQCTTASTT